jgi:hypothetical protein
MEKFIMQKHFKTVSVKKNETLDTLPSNTHHSNDTPKNDRQDKDLDREVELTNGQVTFVNHFFKTEKYQFILDFRHN